MARGKQKRSHEQLTAETDPRVRDPVIFNRIKQMVEHEACHPAWGCTLYRMHRLEQLTNEQKEAGDLYQQIYYDYHRAMDVDPKDLPVDAQEVWERRIDRSKHRWETTKSLLGPRRPAVERIVIDNQHTVSERERIQIKEGLQIISNFFGRGKS